MIVKLPFGSESCPVDLRGVRVRPLVSTAPLGSKDPEGLVRRALDKPIAGPSFEELCAGRGDATVMVQCTERIAPDAVFIPFHFHECVNRIALGLLDPHSRQPAYKQCAVTIEVIEDQVAAAKENVEARAF